jgi:hypothetical protein
LTGADASRHGSRPPKGLGRGQVRVGAGATTCQRLPGPARRLLDLSERAAETDSAAVNAVPYESPGQRIFGGWAGADKSRLCGVKVTPKRVDYVVTRPSVAMMCRSGGRGKARPGGWCDVTGRRVGSKFGPRGEVDEAAQVERGDAGLARSPWRRRRSSAPCSRQRPFRAISQAIERSTMGRLCR